MSLTIIKYHKTPDGFVPISSSSELRTNEQLQTQLIFKVHTRKCTPIHANTDGNTKHTISVWQHSKHIVNKITLIYLFPVIYIKLKLYFIADNRDQYCSGQDTHRSHHQTKYEAFLQHHNCCVKWVESLPCLEALLISFLQHHYWRPLSTWWRRVAHQLRCLGKLQRRCLWTRNKHSGMQSAPCRQIRLSKQPHDSKWVRIAIPWLLPPVFQVQLQLLLQQPHRQLRPLFDKRYFSGVICPNAPCVAWR